MKSGGMMAEEINHFRQDLIKNSPSTSKKTRYNRTGKFTKVFIKYQLTDQIKIPALGCRNSIVWTNENG
jgi:hypothetical protein